MNLMGWVFTLGGILGFLVLLIHAYYTIGATQTGFIFGGGIFAAFLLEFTLVHLFQAYSYRNIPMTLFQIPLVIPMGWVITFYGIRAMILDYLDITDVEVRSTTMIFLTGIVALFYGSSIEILARASNFWVFYFESAEIFGVPIIVSLAWGLSVMVFTGGIEAYNTKNVHGALILLLVLFLNTLIAFLLLELT